MSTNQALRPDKVFALRGVGFNAALVLIVFVLGACQSTDSAPSGTESQPLQADAGETVEIKVGSSPTFDGCASTGPIVNYRWTIIKAPEGMAEYDGKVIREIDPNCSYTLEASMLAEEAGMWDVELEIKDAQGNTSTDQVNVEVEP